MPFTKRLVNHVAVGFWLCLLLATNLVFGQASKTSQSPVIGDSKLLVLTEDSYPLNYLSSDSPPKVTGYATELVHALLAEAQLDYQLELVPWARAFKKASTEKNVLIYSIGRLPSREHLFYWIGNLVEIRYHLYANKAHLRELPQSFTELQQRKVAVIKSDLNHQYMLDNGFNNLVFVNDYSQMNSMLMQKRVDFIASSTIGMYFFTERFGLNYQDFVSVHGFQNLKVSLYIALNKGSDAKLAKRLTEAYQQLVKSGRFDEIMQPFLSQQTTAHTAK